jgi:hypothetical protein
MNKPTRNRNRLSGSCAIIKEYKNQQKGEKRKRSNSAPEYYPIQSKENNPETAPEICLCGANLDLHQDHKDNCIFKD